jgi:hypothetical protein
MAEPNTTSSTSSTNTPQTGSVRAGGGIFGEEVGGVEEGDDDEDGSVGKKTKIDVAHPSQRPKGLGADQPSKGEGGGADDGGGEEAGGDDVRYSSSNDEWLAKVCMRRGREWAYGRERCVGLQVAGMREKARGGQVVRWRGEMTSEKRGIGP